MLRRAVLASLALPLAVAGAQSSPATWPIHSLERPRPPVVHPGGPALVSPPADAVVLFDGRSLDAWRSSRDTTGPAPWRVVDGTLEVLPGAGSIETRLAFGDVQLHLEWMAPNPPSGEGQDRGNSGVFLMGRYEVQVLDSWENRTYADGQAGAIYGQSPPAVNVALPPGRWQSYDILFRRPRFTASGAVSEPARMTVLHNGVVIHANVALVGPTSHRVREPYQAHADRLPLALQDHGDLVRFRNIWIRPLPTRP